MPDIDSDIYTKVVDLEKSFIFIYILYIRYNRKLSKKAKKQGYQYQISTSYLNSKKPQAPIFMKPVLNDFYTFN